MNSACQTICKGFRIADNCSFAPSRPPDDAFLKVRNRPTHKWSCRCEFERGQKGPRCHIRMIILPTQKCRNLPPNTRAQAARQANLRFRGSRQTTSPPGTAPTGSSTFLDIVHVTGDGQAQRARSVE